MEGNREVGMKKMVGGTRTYYPRRCKRSMLTMESIPDEVLFEILVRLRAQDICCAARLVCRKWYHMMRTQHFVYTHLQHATYGLLINDRCMGIVFISVRDGEIETYQRKPRCAFWTSCNGLILEFGGGNGNNYKYVIANHSTGQVFSLPYPCKISYPFLIGIGYVAASGTYKVFGVLEEEKSCSILTVGVDKSWRVMTTDHLSPTAESALCTTPLINEGFMHWQSEGTQVVTLNVDTEIISETSPPITEEERGIYCFPTGRYLSLLKSIGELVWEVWEMKPETGEWRKLPNICLKVDKGRMEGLGLGQGYIVVPCGWVKYREVLAVRIAKDVICFYNLVKREICSKKIDSACSSLLLHKNSLVSLVGLGGGC